VLRERLRYTSCVHGVQAAYKDWLCASLLIGAIGDDDSRQCRAYCHRVARLCPYLLPHVNASYAGEPAFSCSSMYLQFYTLSTTT